MNKININTEFQQVLAFEYSEDKEKLKELLKELKVSVEFLGLQQHFADDKEEREVLKVTIERNNREISFDFGMSLNDTAKKVKEPLKDMLYSILACISSEFYCPIDHEDFCDEYGYDVDSIKAKEFWINCLKQSARLERIFTESEIDCLPR